MLAGSRILVAGSSPCVIFATRQHPAQGNILYTMCARASRHNGRAGRLNRPNANSCGTWSPPPAHVTVPAHPPCQSWRRRTRSAAHAREPRPRGQRGETRWTLSPPIPRTKTMTRSRERPMTRTVSFAAQLRRVAGAPMKHRASRKQVRAAHRDTDSLKTAPLYPHGAPCDSWNAW